MKKEKTASEEIISKLKSEIFKHRIRLMDSCQTDKDFALNHALIYVSNPSIDSLTWLNHYLNKTTLPPLPETPKEEK